MTHTYFLIVVEYKSQLSIDFNFNQFTFRNAFIVINMKNIKNQKQMKHGLNLALLMTILTAIKIF